MNTYKLIKLTVEKVSGINDLSLHDRKRYVADCRIVYFGLSCLYKKQAYHGTECSLAINRDHSTGLNNIAQFNNLCGTEKFKANQVYKKCRIILDPILLYKSKEIQDEINFEVEKIKYLEGILEEEKQELEILHLRKASKMEVTYETA